jgi:hypothetical protein
MRQSYPCAQGAVYTVGDRVVKHVQIGCSANALGKEVPPADRRLLSFLTPKPVSDHAIRSNKVKSFCTAPAACGGSTNDVADILVFWTLPSQS